MFSWAIAFLIVATIAAVFAFAGIAGSGDVGVFTAVTGTTECLLGERRTLRDSGRPQ